MGDPSGIFFRRIFLFILRTLQKNYLKKIKISNISPNITKSAIKKPNKIINSQRFKINLIIIYQKKTIY